MSMMNPLGDWLTVKEAVEMTGYHIEHIRRLVRAGEFTARKWGAAWMIDRQSLLAYLVRIETQGGKRGPKPEKK